MENKYYTPKIEEFYAGFQFEEQSISGLMYHKKEFRFDWFDLKSKIIKGLDSNKIRVKCLDREDIEDCGFKFFSKIENQSVLTFHNEDLNLMLGFYYDTSEIVIITRDPSKSDTYLKTAQDPHRTGFLKIKNKSEFKKLLKQVIWK